MIDVTKEELLDCFATDTDDEYAALERAMKWDHQFNQPGASAP